MVENDIESLVAREHELRTHAEGRGLSVDEQAELDRLQVRLDQLWDLLRRRRRRARLRGRPRRRDAARREHGRELPPVSAATDGAAEPRAASAGPPRRPVILTVDDEPAVLAAVARDLRRRFGEEYRIMRAGSGEEALDLLAELHARGDSVAMLIADQRMPGLDGTAYLTRARLIYPDAKRLLLTAYADTDAAIAAINDARLDYYLLKPGDPPEEHLYPVIADLLTTWEAGATLAAGGARLIGHRFSRETHELRDFLARNGIPGRWLDYERDAEARQMERSPISPRTGCRSCSSRTARCWSGRPCSSWPSGSGWPALPPPTTTTS